MASEDAPGIVSAEWLKDMTEKGTPNLVILDVTWYSNKDALQSYKEKHIPGARSFDVFRGATNTETHNRNIPPADAFQAQAREVGLDNRQHIIVYDSIPGKFGLFLGSRAWWMFRLFGHKNVSVLDGGFDKWLELGYPTTAEVPPVQPGDFTVNFDNTLLAEYDGMVNSVQNQDVQVLDTRAPESYRGNTDDPKSGHLPGAISMPFPLTFVDETTKTVKSPDKLKAVFESAGVDLSKPITGMCNGGMSSSTVAMTSYLLGNKQVPVYLGSFNEWKQRAPDELIKQS